ncbi:MAG TPA: hypothetical protein VHZ32_03810 [Rhizomicrobium sp.]|nr:hypothetical protein [Rhizomicrobium sp.]
MLVEDEQMVGMFMQEVLQTIGYRPTNPVGRLSEAIAAANTEWFLGAVLDMNLNGEIVYPLAELLTAQHVPFLFVTGYRRTLSIRVSPPFRSCKSRCWKSSWRRRFARCWAGHRPRRGQPGPELNFPPASSNSRRVIVRIRQRMLLSVVVYII